MAEEIMRQIEYTPELAARLETAGWQFEPNVGYVRDVTMRFRAEPFHGDYMPVALLTDEQWARHLELVAAWRANRGES